ncbi:MAG: 3-phosphoshikimate 1-carboxyvinyltransferase [Bacteroidales bacterium]|nr:3-phosphoshikimate 1-carboxyvinyltransferase [Bacteroidales bacterium]
MEIRSKRSSLSGDILIPASKSHTIRAVAFASVADGKSVLKNPLVSDDSESALNASMEMGAEIKRGTDWIIKGIGGPPGAHCKHINVGNSGTSLRIFTALCALGKYPVRFDGDRSIRKRPMTPLLSALEMLGVKIVESNEGKCPFTIQGPVRGGSTIVNGISSQFLTSLLIACPLAPEATEIRVENLHEKPYVEMTIDWLRRMGIRFEQDGLDWFKIDGNQQYKAFERVIPGDFSSAAFSLSAAAITNSEILIRGLDFSDHQGDKEVFGFFEKMGLNLKHTGEGILVRSDRLKGIDIDLNNTPDALPAMAVAGCVAEGITRLLNVPQARFKECDRIAACAKELRKMGATVEELEDGLIIHQSKLKGTRVHGYDDHRMVMALSVAGLTADGETIVDTAGSIGVTYPTFIEDMQNIGADMQLTQSGEK